jgi:UDP-N-acetylglucosamine 3-dehydrogenase
VGVIGGGAIAETVHLPAYREIPQVKIVAVCDVNEKRAKRMCRNFGAQAFYSDYRELLKRSDIEAVSICVPNYLHCEQTIAAAKAKKHVLVEKPMATTLEECDKMIEACRENNVKLMVGHNWRFYPPFKRVKEILDRKIVGEISQIRVHTATGGPEKSWPAASKWFFDRKKVGGGCLIDLGIHVIDLLRWLMGDVKNVSSAIASSKQNTGERDGIILLEFKNEVLGEIDASWSSKGSYRSLEISGRKGWILVGPSQSPITIYREGGENLHQLQGLIHPQLPATLSEAMAYTKEKVRLYVESIIQNETPPITGQDGRAALEIVIAAYESAKSGRRISLPLKRGEDCASFD